MRLASLDGRPVRCASGLTLADPLPVEQVNQRLDTLIVAGGVGSRKAAKNGRLLAHLRRLAELSRRVASVCTGSDLLAAAGLLDGRRATTSWLYAAGLAARHPAITVDPVPLYIQDGDIYTSAGVTSGLDLTLTFVADDHGPTLAHNVARALVTYLHRPADQAQLSHFLTAPPPGNAVIGDLIAHITAHPDHDLTTPALAARAQISARHLTRLFSTHLGTTPGRYVRAARTQAAAQLLTTTRLPLTTIAHRCGLGSLETLRQAFLDHYATTASTYRRQHTRPGP